MFAVDGTSRREAAAVMGLAEAARGRVPRLGRLLIAAGSAVGLVEGRARLSPRDRTVARSLVEALDPGALEHWDTVLADVLARSPGTRILTVTADEYPRNLRTVPDPPLFLFVLGHPGDDDGRAVAVVGARHTSEEHLEVAGHIAALLVDAGATVVSGLAAGVDAAAHRAALRAGGRTVAAIATGLDHVYPPQHERLSAAIAASGALVSRSWPDAPPTRRAFRLRNAVTSGLSLATIVVDAGPTGGARLQARIALEQGRPVVLLAHLVRREDWAARLAGRHGVLVADDPAGAVGAVRPLLGAPVQTQLQLFGALAG